MGALCGKESSEPFAQPGRTLGSAPPPGPSSVAVPAAAGKKPAVSAGGTYRVAWDQGHTLGGGAPPSSQDDARQKAAQAAEARNRPRKASGAISQKLASERGKTGNQLLKEGADDARRRREIDAGRDNVAHN